MAICNPEKHRIHADRFRFDGCRFVRRVSRFRPLPREGKEYSAGDLYGCGEVKGCVYNVSEDRRRGMTVALEGASSIRWSTVGKYWPEAYDMADGTENRETVFAYVFGGPLEDGAAFGGYEEKGRNRTLLSPLFSRCENDLNADGAEVWHPRLSTSCTGFTTLATATGRR